MPDNQLDTVKDALISLLGEGRDREGVGVFSWLDQEKIVNAIESLIEAKLAIATQPPSAPAAGVASEAMRLSVCKAIAEALDDGAYPQELHKFLSRRAYENAELWNAKIKAAADAALSAALAGGAGGQEWQDSSSAPTNELVQAFEPHCQGGFQFVGIKNAAGIWHNNLDHTRQYPTHWRPLPVPPAPAQTEGA